MRKVLAVAFLLALPMIASGQVSLPAGVTAEQLQHTFYDYDAKLPLNAELKELPDKTASQTELRTRYHLAYDSAHDQRVTAILTVPKKGKAPYPAAVLLAGSGGHKDTDYVRFASDMLSTLGCATISIDAQYHGERSKAARSGDFHFVNDPTNRDAWVQTVIDLRRAVDYLQSRSDIDMKRVGYMGFSQGGMVGGTFLGLEPRITCALLAIPGGGFIEAAQHGLFKAGSDPQALVNVAVTDPIYFIGRFAPRPLLILSAKKDEMIPKYMTDALYNAAGPGKEIRWFDSGHVLPPKALLVDTKEFFQKYLASPAG